MDESSSLLVGSEIYIHNHFTKKKEIRHEKTLKEKDVRFYIWEFPKGLKQGGGKKWGWIGNTLQYEERKHGGRHSSNT